jgi:hypothetical protein
MGDCRSNPSWIFLDREDYVILEELLGKRDREMECSGTCRSGNVMTNTRWTQISAGCVLGQK